MKINEKILKEIKEKMHKELIEKEGIVDAEKYLLEYLRNLDPLELANKCGGSLDEAIGAIEMFQRSNELKKISLMSKKR